MRVLDHDELAAIEEIVGDNFVLLVPERLPDGTGGKAIVEAYGNVTPEILECMVLSAGLSIMRKITKNGSSGGASESERGEAP